MSKEMSYLNTKGVEMRDMEEEEEAKNINTLKTDLESKDQIEIKHESQDCTKININKSDAVEKGNKCDEYKYKSSNEGQSSENVLDINVTGVSDELINEACARRETPVVQSIPTAVYPEPPPRQKRGVPGISHTKTTMENSTLEAEKTPQIVHNDSTKEAKVETEYDADSYDKDKYDLSYDDDKYDDLSYDDDKYNDLSYDNDKYNDQSKIREGNKSNMNPQSPEENSCVEKMNRQSGNEESDPRETEIERNELENCGGDKICENENMKQEKRDRYGDKNEDEEKVENKKEETETTGEKIKWKNKNMKRQNREQGKVNYGFDIEDEIKEERSELNTDANISKQKLEKQTDEEREAKICKQDKENEQSQNKETEKLYTDNIDYAKNRAGTRTRERMNKERAEETENTKEEDKKEIEKGEKKPLVGLKKELGLVNCVGLIVGNIIGTGIFVSPRAVLEYSGSVGMSLIVWLISGGMAIVGALCYSELGTMIPKSGGNYTYLHESYGPLPAFLLVYMAIMVFLPSNRAVVALSFANYVLQPFFPEGQAPPQAALRIVGILLIVMLTYINCRRVRWAASVQDFLALTKVLALIMIIIVGFYHLYRGTTDNFKNPMEGTTTDPSLVATAFYHTLFAYDGWDSLNGIMEELKNPFRDMPRAIVISLTIVIIIYMLTNMAYFAVLPKELLLATPAVAVTFGSLALGVMAWIIPIFVACSITGGLNGSIFSSSRLLFVSSRRGHLPRVLSFVHINNNTPITALVFMACISMVMFVTSDVRVLINYMAFSSNLINLVCISSFFWFRVKHPDMTRPIKVWIGFPILYVVLSFFLCVFPIVQQPLEVLVGILVLGSGLPVYYFFVHREEKPQCLMAALDKVEYVSQLLFLAAPEDITAS